MTILSYYRTYPTAGGIQYVWSTTTPTVSLTGGTITTSSTVVVGSINISNTVNSITFAQSPYTALVTCGSVICNTTGGIITVNLPDATTAPDEVFYFTNTGTNSVIISAFSGQTIDGSTTSTITSTGNRMLAIQSINGNWAQPNDQTTPDPVITLNSTSIQTCKNLTDPTNIIRCTQLVTTGADVILTATAPPTTGQAFIATGATTVGYSNISPTIISGIPTPAVLYSGATGLPTGDATNFTWNFTKKFLGLGISTAVARLHLASAISAPAWGLNGIALRTDSSTYTDSSSSGTVASNMINAFGTPTLAATTATTYTTASTLYIDNSPTAGTNVTITKPYAFMVGSGDTYHAGNQWLSSAASGVSRKLIFDINPGAKFQLSSTTGEIGLQGGNGFNQQLFSRHGTVISSGRSTTTYPSFQTGSNASYNCVILNTTPNVSNTSNTNNLVLQKSLITPIGTDPAGVASTGDFLQFQTGSGGVGTGSVLAKVDSRGNHYVPHLSGNANIPAANVVAGTGVTAITLTGTDLAGKIVFTTGASTTGNIPLIRVTFVKAFTVAPYVMISATSAATAANIAFFYVTQTTTGFIVTQTGTLPSTGTRSINYRVVG